MCGNSRHFLLLCNQCGILLLTGMLIDENKRVSGKVDRTRRIDKAIILRAKLPNSAKIRLCRF